MRFCCLVGLRRNHCRHHRRQRCHFHSNFHFHNYLQQPRPAPRNNCHRVTGPSPFPLRSQLPPHNHRNHHHRLHAEDIHRITNSRNFDIAAVAVDDYQPQLSSSFPSSSQSPRLFHQVPLQRSQLIMATIGATNINTNIIPHWLREDFNQESGQDPIAIMIRIQSELQCSSVSVLGCGNV